MKKQHNIDKLGAKIVVIGGGTGSFTVLTGLKQYARDITALVNMADDGGSTGVLRDELGALPPGDVRQCLVALSDSPKVRDLFNYRFEEGSLKGHAFGNLFITALEKMTGSFAEAVETASEVLRVEGNVVPATLDNVRLTMTWEDQKVVLNGEKVIDVDHFDHDPRTAKLSLEPAAKANPAALQAIAEADMVVIAPGDLYTSLGPILVADGIKEALAQAPGKVIYICNLVTKKGHTDDFTVNDHAAEIERFVGDTVLDYVLYNSASPSKELQEKYAKKGEFQVAIDKEKLKNAHYVAKSVNLLSQTAWEGAQASDPLAHTRSFIRHDPDRIARQLMKIYFS